MPEARPISDETRRKYRERAMKNFFVRDGVLISRRTGLPAGHRGGSSGRLEVSLCGHTMQAGRVVWLIEKDEWPPTIEHKNRDPFNDSIENLCGATGLENHQNKCKPGTRATGVIGVTWTADYAGFIIQTHRPRRTWVRWTWEKAVKLNARVRAEFGLRVPDPPLPSPLNGPELRLAA